MVRVAPARSCSDGSRLGSRGEPSKRIDTQPAVIVAYKSRHDEASPVQIECVFFGPFREDVGEKTISPETDAETVGGLLRELEAEYPPLEGRLVDENGEGIAGKTVVTKNKRDVRHVAGLATPLEEGDVFRLVPSVYGG